MPDPPPPASHLNSCGVAAASPAFAPRLRALCETMCATPAAAARLAPWGLQVGAGGESWEEGGGAEAVGKVLRARREALCDALTRPEACGPAPLPRRSRHTSETPPLPPVWRPPPGHRHCLHPLGPRHSRRRGPSSPRTAAQGLTSLQCLLGLSDDEWAGTISPDRARSRPIPPRGLAQSLGHPTGSSLPAPRACTHRPPDA